MQPHGVDGTSGSHPHRIGQPTTEIVEIGSKIGDLAVRRAEGPDSLIATTVAPTPGQWRRRPSTLTGKAAGPRLPEDRDRLHCAPSQRAAVLTATECRQECVDHFRRRATEPDAGHHAASEMTTNGLVCRADAMALRPTPDRARRIDRGLPFARHPATRRGVSGRHSRPRQRRSDAGKPLEPARRARRDSRVLSRAHAQGIRTAPGSFPFASAPRELSRSQAVRHAMPGTAFLPRQPARL